MNFGLTEEQEMIVKTTRDFVTQEPYPQAGDCGSRYIDKARGEALN